jgi:hypothetical protein
MDQGQEQIILNRRLVGLLASLFLFATVSLALAIDPLPIASVLSHPDQYLNHLTRNVMFRGVIRQPVDVPTIWGRISPAYETCRFLLDDGTGTIEVHARGCPPLNLQSAEQSHFKVTVNATIVPGLKDGTKDGTIIAIANKILIDDKHN